MHLFPVSPLVFTKGIKHSFHNAAYQSWQLNSVKFHVYPSFISASALASASFDMISIFLYSQHVH
jgi:hypothetical protein